MSVASIPRLRSAQAWYPKPIKNRKIHTYRPIVSVASTAVSKTARSGSNPDGPATSLASDVTCQTNASRVLRNETTSSSIEKEYNEGARKQKIKDFIALRATIPFSTLNS